MFKLCKVDVWMGRDKPMLFLELLNNRSPKSPPIWLPSQEMIFILTNAYHNHRQEPLAQSGRMDLPSPWISLQCFQGNLHSLSQGCPRGHHPSDEMRAGLKMFCWAPWNPKMMDQDSPRSIVRTVIHSSFIHPWIHSFLPHTLTECQLRVRQGLRGSRGWEHQDKNTRSLPSRNSQSSLAEILRHI